MSENPSDTGRCIDTAEQKNADDSHGRSENGVTADPTPVDPTEYAEVACGTVAASLSDVRIQSTAAETSLAVTAIHDDHGMTGVDLRWETDATAIGVSLDEDVTRALIQRLRVALAELDRESSAE